MSTDAESIMFNTIQKLIQSDIDRGKTQFEVADAIGISQSAITKIANNRQKTMQISTMLRCIDYYGLNVSKILSGVEQSPSPCSASPVCQDICHICEGLSDYWKHELLEYAQFIKTKDIKNKSNDNLSGGVISDTDRGKQKQ